MYCARQPDVLIDAEKDDLITVANKLGVESSLELEKIVLKENHLNYLNNERDNYGNTLLMKFVKLGKADIMEFLLKCDGLHLNDMNKSHDTAADIAWTEKQHVCLLKLLQGEAEFPYTIDKSEVNNADLIEFLKHREKLHEDIKLGDFQSVKDLTKDQKPSMYLSLKRQSFPRNQSALSWAAECNQLKVFAYLLNHGAKFKDSYEEKGCVFNDQQRKELNDLLEEYFIKVDNSHILKLMHSSHSPQGFNDERKVKIKDIYDHLNNSKFVSLMMKVLEYEDVDVIFDFRSDHTDRVYCLNNPQIDGLTVPRIQKIFIGAKKCESSDTVSTDVAGTLAHELCHMAMLVLYGNEAKPYEEGNERIKEFAGIVQSVQKSCEEKSAKIDPVIKMVFKYNPREWHSELIARVPHILAMYGDVEGEELLKQQAKGLFEFYSHYVAPKCRSYTDPVFFKKHLCIIESLHEYHGCVQGVDKETSPLKEPSKSFKDYLIPCGNISVIVTTNTKLCCLHVYHELKKFYPYHLDKRCLFFKLNCFQSNWEKTMNAFRCKVCHYMVLVTNEKMLDFKGISKDFKDVITCVEDKIANSCEEMKKVILIIREECEGLGPDCKKKVLNYQWRDLSDSYKHRCIHQKVNFKGKGTSLMRWISEEKISNIIQPEDMLRLTNNEQIQFGDGRQLTSQGYNKDYYMEREFANLTIKKSIFDGLPGSAALFITGLRKEDLKGLEIDEEQIQWVKDSCKEVDKKKRMFLLENDLRKSSTFNDIFKKRLPADPVHWLHFTKKEFHLRMSKGNTEEIEEHITKRVLSELRLIETSMERVILISDDPGMGKSTIVTELIRIIKDKRPDWWVGRIDLNDYSDDDKNPLGLANIEENSTPDNVLNIFIRMLGMKTSLEVYLFQKFIKPNGLKGEYKIFFDGLDEVTSTYKGNVMKLFQVLIKETILQLWITTRKHEKVDLETEFDTFSYSMEQFTVDHQTRFLDRFWKYKMKSLGVQNSEEGSLRAIETIEAKIGDILKENSGCDEETFNSLRDLKDELKKKDSKIITYDKLQAIRSGIEGIDFTPCARLLLNEASIKEEERSFMGIPLHLFMLGNVTLDKNFRRTVHSNIHNLYSEFVEGKIRIYWKEKEKIQHETGIMKKMFNCQRKEIIDSHKRIAKCVMESKPWDSVMDSDKGEVIVSVGIATKLGDHFHFIHRTFAEYFFADWMMEMIDSGNLEAKTLLDVLLDDRYGVVRRFLDSAIQRQGMEVTFSKAFIEMLKVGEIFVSFMLKGGKDNFSGKYVFRSILASMEKECRPCEPLFFEFINSLDKFFRKDYWDEPMRAFKLLSVCLTDAMLFELFNVRIKFINKFAFSLFRNLPGKELSEVLEVLERVLRTEGHLDRVTDTSLQGDEGNRDELDRVVHREEKRFELFSAKDWQGNNILHFSSSNRDENVIFQVLTFCKGFLGEEGTRNHLLERNRYSRSIAHDIAWIGSRNVVEVLQEIESILGVRSVIEILIKEDENNCNFLHCAARHCQRGVFTSLLEYLDGIMDCELLREMLFKEDKFKRNIMHSAAWNRNADTFVEILQKVLINLEDEEDFKEFVARGDKHDRTIFHFRASYTYALRDLNDLQSYIGKGQFGELLAKANVSGFTCLHLLIRNARSVESVVSDLSFISEVLDVSLLEKFILASDLDGDTFLHKAVDRDMPFHDVTPILSQVKCLLSEVSFQALMDACNNKGERVRIVEDGEKIKLETYT